MLILFFSLPSAEAYPDFYELFGLFPGFGIFVVIHHMSVHFEKIIKILRTSGKQLDAHYTSNREKQQFIFYLLT